MRLKQPAGQASLDRVQPNHRGSPGGVCQRNNISGVENGIAIGGIDGGTKKTIIRDNYIHDNASPGNPDPHYDGIAMQGGQRNILIEHNHMTGSGLSAVCFIKTDYETIDGVTVNNNKFVGGGYTCYAHQVNNPIPNVRYTNNHLGGWVYGPAYVNCDIVWEGNVSATTGAPVPMSRSVRVDEKTLHQGKPRKKIGSSKGSSGWRSRSPARR